MWGLHRKLKSRVGRKHLLKIWEISKNRIEFSSLDLKAVSRITVLKSTKSDANGTYSQAQI